MVSYAAFTCVANAGIDFRHMADCVKSIEQDWTQEVWGARALNRKGVWSVRVSGNWRITFAFAGTDADAVDYEDYH